MKQNQLVYGVIGAIIGGVLVWFLMANAVNNNMSGMMQMMGVRSSTLSANATSIDAHFIEQMIPHHKDAITMATLAETNARHDDVKQLAQNIIASQGDEILQMQEWYTSWFGKEVPTGGLVMDQHGMMGSATQNAMHMGMMGSAEDITRLEQAEDFDKAFIEEMIPHHQMAVMMANILKNGTTRPEMKKLADDIISAQTTEINQMRQWYKNWGYTE